MENNERPYQSDIEIARSAPIRPISEIAQAAGIPEACLEHYGKYKAKIDSFSLPKRSEAEGGKLVLVTAITPTPAGEGKRRRPSDWQMDFASLGSVPWLRSGNRLWALCSE